MGDSSSFSSLFALVDNHLSRSNIQQDETQPSASGMGSFRLPKLNMQRGLSDTGLASPSPKFPVPSLTLSAHPINDTFAKQLSNMLHEEPKKEIQGDTLGKPIMCMSDCPINDVLAIQLSNMFKAREAKEEEKRIQEELKKVKENIQRLRQEESSCLIDLMPAVQQAGQVRPQHVEILSSSSSMESVVIPDATDSVDEDVQETIAPLDIQDRPESPKQITEDMSYILKHKIGKCSQFGKVLCARYRPVAAPYLKIYIPSTKIKVFDFSTPSPDDIVLARLKKPTASYHSSSSTLAVYE